MNKDLSLLLEIIKAAVNEDKLNISTKDCNWDEIKRITEKHTLDNVVYFGISHTKDQVPKDFYTLLERKKQNSQLLKAVKDCDVENVMSMMEKAKIPHMPLKGWHMRKLYPDSLMRSMSDVDILTKKDDSEKIADIMKTCGYSVQCYGDKADVYVKRPKLCIEIHRSLVEENGKLSEYYDNIWEKIKPAHNLEYMYEMTDEDFYIFHIVHMAKHFKGSGIGIRAFMDIYIWAINKWENINSDYVMKELDKIGLRHFENVVRKVSFFWFANEKNKTHISTYDNIESVLMNDEKVEELSEMIASEMITGGVYGNKANAEIALINKQNKFVWFIRMIFPTMQKMRFKYHTLKKWPVLYPVFLLRRWFELIFFNRKKVKNKMSILNVEQDVLDEKAKFSREMGLTEIK